MEQVDGDVRVGQTWVDVTAPGPRPAMETTALDRPRSWTERGRWRSIEAELTLAFAPRAGGCVVQPSFALRGRGPTALVVRVLTLAAPVAVRADLRRAARILSERGAGQ